MAAGMLTRRNLSRWELSVGVAMILVLVGMTAERIRTLMGVAERYAMIATLSTLRTALNSAAMVRMARHDEAGIGALATANPMDVAGQRPYNYVGEFSDSRAAKLGDGVWFFDRRAHLLVYKLDRTAGFHSSLPGPERVRFRVSLEYQDRNANGRYDPGIDGFTLVHLLAVEPYTWR